LRRQKENGPRRVIVGLELQGRNIARQGYVVLKEGVEVGRVTSGAFAPTCQKSLCMASIERAANDKYGEYRVVIRGKEAHATMTTLPFYASRAR
jgi:aminomethyltransferase